MLPTTFIKKLRWDHLSFLRSIWHQYGDVARINIGPWSVFLINNPDDIKHILHTNIENYSKATRGYEILSLITGKGLITSEGDLWKRQRQLIGPVFHKNEVKRSVECMPMIIERVMNEWRDKVHQEMYFDISRDLGRMTVNIALETLCGTKSSKETNDLVDIANDLGPALFQRMSKIINAPLFIPTKNNQILRHGIQYIEQVVDLILERHKKETVCPHSMISIAQNQSEKKFGQPMSDKQLRSEVITGIFAGFETTAVTLSWVLYNIARFPSVQEKLQQEVDSVLQNRRPCESDVNSLRYTRQIVMETLRLFPPVPAVTRRAKEQDILGGYPIPARSVIYINPSLIHQHTKYWDQPEKFNPERFLPGVKPDPYAYIPFGAGVRKCVGFKFAEEEVILVISMIAQRYTVRLEDNFQPKIMQSVSLRSGNGMVVKLQSRN